ncbi:hypothetical protein SUGI_0658310 [Cryptomeria japonica]|nr:hypothetical protein SUGI_0658310 [Cryptomeria japonica]
MHKGNSASLHMDPTLWGRLPPSILNRIFATLPIHSLLRFRTLSKNYNNLPLHPAFARLHRSLAPPTLMLITHISSTNSHLIQCVDENASHHLFHWDFLHLSSVFRRLQLIARASASGFLCFSLAEKGSNSSEGPKVFYICNPITRQWRTFRLPSEIADPLIVGMFFDGQTGSCKVIAGANLSGSHQSGRAFVYDGLGASWKEIAPLPNLYAKASPPVSIGGRLYWLVEEANVWGSGQRWAIGFDTDKEIWREPISVSKEFVPLCLGESQEKLVLLTMEEPTSGELAIQVWNLDQKLKWVWEHTINIKVDVVNAPAGCRYSFRPTGGVVSGGVMWLTENRFQTVVKYDLRQQTPLGSQAFVKYVSPVCSDKLLVYPLGFEPTVNRIEDCINFNNCN